MLRDLYRLLKTRVNVSGLLLGDRIRRSVGVHVGSLKVWLDSVKFGRLTAVGAVLLRSVFVLTEISPTNSFN